MLQGFKNINSRYRCAKNIQRYAYRIPGIFLKEPVEQRKQKDKLKVAGRHLCPGFNRLSYQYQLPSEAAKPAGFS
ncbi:MAG: hypothetical protein KME11_19635 [Timaviella obliquedivisa GSE-PSE-MK23-08B]|jgi:hypothetical protein|nr:hypothetical protein [Timaviella obliquedivisa GSE-PSE-MK23-08B]